MKSNNFGQHTWDTLFTYRTNSEIIIKTIELYSNLLQQASTTTNHSSLDILRIKQQVYLDTISKIFILIESFLILIDSLSQSYNLVSKNMIGYKLGTVNPIIKKIRTNSIEYDMRLVLGLFDISKMSFLSEQQMTVLETVYDDTQNLVINKLRNIAEFYDEFSIVYMKTKHGLTYYSGLVPTSSHDNNFVGSLLICMDQKTSFDKKVLERYVSKQNNESIFFNLLSYVKFNKILDNRINSVLDDLLNLIRFVCDNHLAYAMNCGEYYLPFKEEKNNIVSNFSPDIFTSKFTEDEFNEMFKMILTEMNTEYPPLDARTRPDQAINELLNDRGIANVKLT